MPADDWCRLPAVAAAFAGSGAGAGALAPALRRLRSAIFPSRLVLLWPAGIRAPASLSALCSRRLCYLAPVPRSFWRHRTPDDWALRFAQALLRERIAGLIVFTEPGYAPTLPAYLCCLAGVERRAGITAEFTGGILSDPVAPPPDTLAPAQRHLYLLAALNLVPRLPAEPVPLRAGALS